MSRHDPQMLPSAAQPDDGGDDGENVPAPGMRGAIGKVRGRLNNLLNESVPMDGGHGSGYGAPHGNSQDVAALGNGHGDQVPAGVAADSDPDEHPGS
jgi:hypothetical protein